MATVNVHRHLVVANADALRESFQKGKYSDQVIEQIAKAHPKWGSRDRRLFAEQVFELVRWWRLYWFLADREIDFSTEALTALWGAHVLFTEQELPLWPEFEGFSLSADRIKSAKAQRAVIQSVPEWLDSLASSELGERWPFILESLNTKAPVDLRVNLLKAQRAQVVEALAAENIEVDMLADSKEALVLRKRQAVQKSRSFLAGQFEIQDRSSQLVAPFMKLEPGQRVIDACAGGGGKTLHIATLLKNRGQVLAMDVSAQKLERLRERSKRNGFEIVQTKVHGDKTVDGLAGWADRLLLDVPCSGLGVIRRKPDTKWKLTQESLAEVRSLQNRILSEYSVMTKVGGLMVYSTCSVLPSENESQVSRFLQEKGDSWTLEEQRRCDPDLDQGDGFFMARMRRNH